MPGKANKLGHRDDGILRSCFGNGIVNSTLNMARFNVREKAMLTVHVEKL